MANEGHELDASTFALWRFNETGHQASNYEDAADETGNYDASQAVALDRPSIVGGPNGAGDFARWFLGESDVGLGFTPDGAMQAVLIDDFTIEAWVYCEDATLGEGSIFSVKGSGESEAANSLIEFLILNTGKLQAEWEQGLGVNETVTQVAGGTVSAKTWTYVAMTSSVSAGDRTVNFYIDSGTSQDSGTATNATGGTTSPGFIGVSLSVSELFGGIARIRLSDTVRSPTELNDNATDLTFQFSNDGSTIALWDFQETPEVLDLGPNGLHLHNTIYTTTPPRIVDPHVMDGGKSRSCVAAAESFTIHKREEIRSLLLGEYTVEFWGQLQTIGLLRQFFNWEGPGETEAENTLARIGFNESTGDYVLSFFAEEGAGVDTGGTGTLTVVSDNVESAQDAQQRHHYAFVVEDAGGGQRNILVYLDSVLIDTVGPYNTPTGGTDPSSTNGLLLFEQWEGDVDDMRISSVARTLSEIQDSYSRGVFNGVGAQPAGVAPTVTVVSPTDGNISLNQPLVLNVTDVDSGIKRSSLYVTFSTGTTSELIYPVWNGVTFEFAANYTGSFITPITNGFQYRLLRTGGWPGSPSFVADILDDDCNENT